MEKPLALAAALERIGIRDMLASAASAAIARSSEALGKANTHLGERQRAAFVEAFSAQLPALVEAMLSEHVNTLTAWLSDEELGLLAEVLQHPDSDALMGFMQRSSSCMLRATDEVMRLEGAQAHRQSLAVAMASPSYLPAPEPP